MPPPPRADEPLWHRVARSTRDGDAHSSSSLASRWLHGAGHSVSLAALAGGSSLDYPLEELAGSAVLIATADQLTAALAIIELDGIARRIVLCPPDVQAEHLPLVIEIAQADVIVHDDGRTPATVAELPARIRRVVRCRPSPSPAGTAAARSNRSYFTEWILLTSGTTGLPKLVQHTLASLAAPMQPRVAGAAATAAAAAAPGDAPPVWSTFYDIRRYGGLQIFLRAILGGGSIVLSSPHEPVADFLARAGRHGVMLISGTPSHWRRALMSPGADRFAPHYVRLSGEIADQPILDDLRAFYRDAAVGHAFASTEAGVAFEVDDGLAGFPADVIGRPDAEVEMKIEDGSLRIRSARTAARYLGDEASQPLRDPDGFVDTGDMVERRGGRYYFVGRRGGIINVGGAKVHPEEVEAVINRHPAVQMSLARPRKNPFTGAIVVAEIVLRSDGLAAAGDTSAALQRDIIELCRRTLPPHKVPAALRFVPALTIGAAGKLARSGS